MNRKLTNVVIAGLGGQGVLTASDILAEAAFRAGHDVKKSELHGMAQRGGSVTSDVRFGEEIWSPMVPAGEADYLVVISPDQVELCRHHLREGGVLVANLIEEKELPNRRSMNVALLGALSAYLDIGEAEWLAAIRARLAPKLHEANERAFALGRKRASRLPGDT